MSKEYIAENANDFLKSLIAAYPKEDFPTLRKIIGIGSVRFEDRELIPGMPMTAAVVNTKPYTLLFGRKFIEENTETLEDCVYLLSHELTHLVLDHFAEDIIEEFEEKKLARNASHIIVDCQVNATCYNSLKEEKYLEFVKRFYSKTEMPYCFLRPDGEPPSDELKALHSKLYSESGITNKELIDGLMDWFKEQEQNLQDMIKKLLGNHRDMSKNRSTSSEELSDLAKSMAEDLLKKMEKNQEGQEECQGQGNKDGEPSPEDDGQEPGSKGCSPTGSPRQSQIKTCLDKIEYVKNIASKLKNSDVVSPSSRIYKAIDFYLPKKETRSVVPNFHDRRTSVLYSRGKLPIFHRTPQFGSKVVVPCYLDISGSQDHVLPVMLPVVSRLKSKIGDVVYCFSTYVSETKVVDLRDGKLNGSGGTDFNPVVNHIIKKAFKHAVILTDGQAYLDPSLVDALRRRGVDITVGWTVSNPSLRPLSEIASKTFYVFGDRETNDC